ALINANDSSSRSRTLTGAPLGSSSSKRTIIRSLSSACSILLTERACSSTSETGGKVLFKPKQDTRSRREPVHFPTKELLLPRVGRDPNQFPVSLSKMNTKLE